MREESARECSAAEWGKDQALNYSFAEHSLADSCSTSAMRKSHCQGNKGMTLRMRHSPAKHSPGNSGFGPKQDRRQKMGAKKSPVFIFLPPSFCLFFSALAALSCSNIEAELKFFLDWFRLGSHLNILYFKFFSATRNVECLDVTPMHSRCTYQSQASCFAPG
jgi:hypothetical protein